jgi:hypothetical protein
VAFVLSPGCSVSNLNLEEEGFRIGSVEDYQQIVLSVSFPNLERTFTSLAAIVTEPVYFLLAVPCTQDEEKALDPDTCPHDFVYYFDAVTVNRALGVYYKHSDVLLNDGLVNFGIASKNPRDEVYVGKYKIICVFRHVTGKYVSELVELGFTQRSG